MSAKNYYEGIVSVPANKELSGACKNAKNSGYQYDFNAMHVHLSMGLCHKHTGATVES